MKNNKTYQVYLEEVRKHTKAQTGHLKVHLQLQHRWSPKRKQDFQDFITYMNELGHGGQSLGLLSNKDEILELSLTQDLTIYPTSNER